MISISHSNISNIKMPFQTPLLRVYDIVLDDCWNYRIVNCSSRFSQLSYTGFITCDFVCVKHIL